MNKDPSNMTKEELIEAIEAIEALEKIWKYNKVATYFTDNGKNARSNYPKQMELMRAGKDHRIRAFIGGNGSGKSIWQSIESYFHLSGKYPKWWDGYRFDKPIQAWLCSKDSKSLRDGLQVILFGGIGDDDFGTGIIPREDMSDDNGVLQKWAMAGTANCIGQFRVRHYTNGIFDGWSVCGFKTYDQGWQSYQGPTLDWIGFDEEPEDDGKIFAESIMRLRPRDGDRPGHFLATFTPTGGMRSTYLAFVPNGVYPEGGLNPNDPTKFTQRVGWSSSPHLTDEWKKSAIENLKLTDPNNIEARTEGYAAMGSGRIYPIDEDFVIVPKQHIPTYWPKCLGIDPGAVNFGVIWIAEDPNTGVKYIYEEYKQSQRLNYIIHVEAIKARGEWISGGIDPHEAVKPRDTGESVQTYFESYGIELAAAKGDPNAMRLRIRAMFDAGAIKIMDNCTRLINEIRTYRGDPNDPNKPARDQDDHLLDAMLYCLVVFDSMKKSYAQLEDEITESRRRPSEDSGHGRNDVTGY